MIKISKFKYFCKNVSARRKAKSAKRKTAKLEKKMNKLADRADKICKNRYDFEILANKIYQKRDYRLHMERFKPHNYKFEED